MIGLMNQTDYTVAAKVLDWTQKKHEAIATNIAHADVPGYHRLEVDPSFRDQVDLLLKQKTPHLIAHLPEPMVIKDPQSIDPGLDGNSIHLPDELADLSETQLKHQLATQCISDNLKQLKLAITGRTL